MSKQLSRCQLLVAAVVVAFVLTGTATAAAKPSPLYSTTGGWSCTHGATNTSGATFGSASIRAQQSGTDAMISMRLRNAAPNTTYSLVLMQTVGSTCFIPLPFATLTTNDGGAGSVRTTATLNPNATSRNILVRLVSQPAFATAL